MSKHTSGPWRVEKVSAVVGGGSCIPIMAGKTMVVATVGYDDDDQDMIEASWADAHLIAATPDLLSIAKRWAALNGGEWHAERHAREKAELLRDTQAAIAKASPARPSREGGGE